MAFICWSGPLMLAASFASHVAAEAFDKPDVSATDLSPLPDWVKKLVCEAVDKEEPHVAPAVCKKVAAKIPQLPEEECEAVVGKFVQAEAQKVCPQLTETALPDWVKKLVCEAVNKEEPNVAPAVCKKVTAEIPLLPEEMCEAEVGKFVHAEAQKVCPQLTETALPDWALPGWVKKLVCEAVNEKAPNVATVVCKKVTAKIRFLPKKLCEAAVDKFVQAQAHKVCPPASAKCESYGCVSYTREHKCQCNPGCINYNNCCDDYDQTCKGPSPPIAATCKAYGCGKYSHYHKCQCNAACKFHKDCCDDYYQTCKHELVV